MLLIIPLTSFYFKIKTARNFLLLRYILSKQEENYKQIFKCPTYKFIRDYGSHVSECLFVPDVPNDMVIKGKRQ